MAIFIMVSVKERFYVASLNSAGRHCYEGRLNDVIEDILNINPQRQRKKVTDVTNRLSIVL
jgi:hypothetical protein